MNQATWVTGGLAVLGLVIGYFGRFWLAKRSQNSLEQKVQKDLETANSQAKEIVVSAKDKAASIVAEAQKEERERQQELRKVEERLVRKEETLDKERSRLDGEAARIRKETEQVAHDEEALKTRGAELSKEFEKVAGLSRDEARDKLFADVENENKKELGETLIRLERERRDAIEAKSLDIITSAIQRYARDYIADVTTTAVPIPNEELKGKIIGREGRNIRTFERLTGVEVIVDETPESIILSSFDPLRRELAKIALEKLIKDGRIQPAKIEEKVEEAKNQLDDHIRKIGEDAAYEVGILDLPKELNYLLGRLNYRTSYGQNVLQHSLEMTHIAGMMAAELGISVPITKKAALLHDIGKAIDHEVEGTHVELGRKLLKKYGIEDAVIKGMEAHHEEYPYSTPESYIVAAADAISAARPGARRDTLEKYLKRLEDIEKVTSSFDGVKQAYAVAAGREVRVFVVPEKIDDFGAIELAKKIAGKIQNEVGYPGEIKVTVIRETKAVEYAR